MQSPLVAVLALRWPIQFSCQTLKRLVPLGPNFNFRRQLASCRCAVAHARTNPTVDPENWDDMERLSKDLPLIRAMAAHVIEKELNVKSQHTVWAEHLSRIHRITH